MDELVVQEEVQEEVKPLYRLQPKQQRLVHLYLSGGYTLAQLADMIGVSINTVRSWLRNEEIRAYIDDFQKEEHEIAENALKNLRADAINKLSELVNSENDQVALSAVKDVLDRVGHKAINKVEKTVSVSYEQQLNELIGKTIIDASYEEVN